MKVAWGSLCYYPYFWVYFKISVIKVCLLNVHVKEEFMTGLWMTSRQTLNLHYSKPLKMRWNLPGKFTGDRMLQAVAAPQHERAAPQCTGWESEQEVTKEAASLCLFQLPQASLRREPCQRSQLPHTSSPQTTTFLKIWGPYWRMSQLHAKSRGDHK